jgi:hypothetical protein
VLRGVGLEPRQEDGNGEQLITQQMTKRTLMNRTTRGDGRIRTIPIKFDVGTSPSAYVWGRLGC